MSVPSPWVAVLLALAAWRVYRLISEDTILDGPRNRLLRIRGWDGESDPPSGYRQKLDTFITCPYCCGFWVSVVWWGAWLAAPTWTAVIATPWAIAAVVPLVAKNLD